MGSEPERRCELCDRVTATATRHHLVPRSRHSGRRARAASDRAELRERVAWLCVPCHKQVHAIFSEKELERSYDTVEKLAAHPEVERFVRWVRGRPDGTRVIALRSKRRGRGGRGPR